MHRLVGRAGERLERRLETQNFRAELPLWGKYRCCQWAGCQEPTSLQPRSILPPEVHLVTKATLKAHRKTEACACICLKIGAESRIVRAEPMSRACVLAARGLETKFCFF